jgi:hypothetical protein
MSRLIVFEIGTHFLRIGDASSPPGSASRVRSPPLIRALLVRGLLAAPRGSAARAALLARVHEELTLVCASILSRAVFARAAECRVLVVEPRACPRGARAAFARALLCGVGAASVAFVGSACAAAAGARGGGATALVVDVGAAGARAAPVVRGALVCGAVRESGAGGAALTGLAAALAARRLWARSRESAAADAGAGARSDDALRSAGLPSEATLLPVQASAALGCGFREYGSAAVPSRAELADDALLRAGVAGLAADPFAVSGRDALQSVFSHWVHCALERRMSGTEASAMGDASRRSAPLPATLARAAGVRADALDSLLESAAWQAIASGALLINARVEEVDVETADAMLDDMEGAGSGKGSAVRSLLAQSVAAARAARSSIACAPSVAELLVAALLAAPIDERAALAQHIVLVGSVAGAAGFWADLVRGVTELSSAPRWAGVRPLLPRLSCANQVSPEEAAWEGAATLALAVGRPPVDEGSGGGSGSVWWNVARVRASACVTASDPLDDDAFECALEPAGGLEGGELRRAAVADAAEARRAAVVARRLAIMGDQFIRGRKTAVKV